MKRGNIRGGVEGVAVVIDENFLSTLDARFNDDVVVEGISEEEPRAWLSRKC